MNTVVHPKGWLPAQGYANGIFTTDGHLYIGGQIGWNAQQESENYDFILQMRQNVVAVLNAAGAGVEDIVRLTWYVIDKREYLARQAEVGKAYRDIMGRHLPAMTMVVVSGLVEDRALLAIEATAVISQPHSRD
ncbi:RidA family protein [Shewanella sp.]|uniref:RidA family protein n=1 Tax=Shewanella sp. TaxID=50422 RepID=UPI004047FD82